MPRLWVFTDGRAGHISQLKGLIARVRVRIAIEEHWLDLSGADFHYTGPAGLRRQFDAAAEPDWVIGAGRRCHLPMLWTRWRCAARSLVLMRPGLPLSLFDAAVIPRHDSPPLRQGVLVTQGVLNAIEPNTGARDPDLGLMLLGGVGRHYEWDDGVVLRQVLAIAAAQPGVSWRVADSPRTPAGFLERVAAEQRENIETVAFGETDRGWVGRQLCAAAQAWVSCDSVSMVYESVSAAAPTGLIGLRPARRSRVTASMDNVVADGLATPFDGADLVRPLAPPGERLWEADRAAEWFIDHAGLAVNGLAE